jgi:hypothetical protein
VCSPASSPSTKRSAACPRREHFLVGTAVVSVTLFAAQPKPSGTTYPSKRMADGKLWTTQNLSINTAQA